jgi:tRNA pseudouridine55 synthase
MSKKTKEISKFQGMSKTYTGTFKLGTSTPSMDGETEPLKVKEYSHLSNDDILEAGNSFQGEIEQIPPMYSALKHKGRSLYKYARKGIEIEREPRKVFVEKFSINRIDLPFVDFEIFCSKGTYIRVIADDLGKKLNCGAYLYSLRRTGIGKYNVEDAVTTRQLNDINILEEQPV